MRRTDGYPDLSHWLYALAVSILLACLLLDSTVKITALILTYTPAALPAQTVLMNLCCFLVLQCAFLLLSGNLHASSLLTAFVGAAYMLTDLLVFQYRGRAVIFQDLAAFGTAMRVLPNYQLPDLMPFLCRVHYPIIFCVILLRLRFPAPKRVLRRLLPLLGGALCLLLLFFGAKSYAPVYWDVHGAEKNGMLFNFYLTVLDSKVDPPAGYSPETADKLAQQYRAAAPAKTDLPDIVVIMNESFADLDCLGTFTTNREVLPFLRSLKGTAITGTMLSPALGGNTVMPEWECLTGHTTTFLSESCSPYQQYMSGPAFSVATYLRDLGYDTVGMHPYHASGWNRENAYPWLGLDKTMFLEDFPQESFVRDYLSDQELYEQILEELDSGSDAPKFLFAVSMQNHGGYGETYAEGEQIVVTEPQESFDEVNHYLTLVHETDRATQWLTDQLAAREKPTYVLFFGDHQPQLPSAFYDTVQKGDSDDVRMIEQHLTPFFIWSNRDIESTEIPVTSANYLAPLLLEAAGIPQPAYFSYLLELRERLPAMTSFACYSAERQTFLPPSELVGEDAERYNTYAVLQYNALFDDKHQNQHFFGISE